MSDRTFKVGAALVVSLAALVALGVGYEAWFAPMMDCLGSWQNN
ncbi:MAG TPA: hypothetical protein VF662_12775 [Allosphingosinicella sp.]|jgi:hypothetical protein